MLPHPKYQDKEVLDEKVFFAGGIDGDMRVGGLCQEVRGGTHC